jgi:hypothetical protein
MGYGVVHQFPGSTEAQCRASIAAVPPSDGSLPEGQILHVAGACGDGWLIVAIHDSEGKLGAVPRRHSDAPAASGHRRRV